MTEQSIIENNETGSYCATKIVNIDNISFVLIWKAKLVFFVNIMHVRRTPMSHACDEFEIYTKTVHLRIYYKSNSIEKDLHCTYIGWTDYSPQCIYSSYLFR